MRISKAIENKKTIGIGMIAMLAITFGCIDPYTPGTTVTDYHYLVVDGFFNSTDTSYITLSRTQTIQSASDSIYETGATVAIEEEGGSSYPFTEKGTGVYFLRPGLVNAAQNVRLVISTKDGKEYASVFVANKTAPPIDDIIWKTAKNGDDPGIQVAVNTHDASGNTRYYLWQYEETWEYASKFKSDYIRIGDSISIRTEEQDVSHCWRTLPSTQIIINSTTALSEDVVSQYPLTFVNKLSPKLSFRYSMLVHQYALTAEAYLYWQSIQKNSENVGTVFGPLPSQIAGNLTCTNDANEKILGYFSSSSESTLRFNVERKAVGDSLGLVNMYNDGYATCYGTDVFVPLDKALEPTSNLYLYGVYQAITLIGYQQGPAQCADCRYKGGVTKQPSWW